MSTEAAEQEARMKKKRAPGPSGREDVGMSPRAAAGLARSVCAVSLLLAGIGLLLLVLGQEHPGVPVFEEWVEDTVTAVGFSTVGAVIAHRFPSHNPIGWLFCALGLVAAVLLFCGEYAAYSLVARDGSLPGGETAAWIVTWLWVLHSGLFAFLGLLFPDGRLPPPRWRPFAWMVVVAMVFGTFTAAFSPGLIDSLGTISNPLGIEGAPAFHDLVEVLVFALTLVSAASVLVRFCTGRTVWSGSRSNGSPTPPPCSPSAPCQLERQVVVRRTSVFRHSSELGHPPWAVHGILTRRLWRISHPVLLPEILSALPRIVTPGGPVVKESAGRAPCRA